MVRAMLSSRYMRNNRPSRARRHNHRRRPGGVSRRGARAESAAGAARIPGHAWTWRRCSRSGRSSRSSTHPRTADSIAPSVRPRGNGWRSSRRSDSRPSSGGSALPEPLGPSRRSSRNAALRRPRIRAWVTGPRLTPEEVRIFRDEPLYDTGVLRTLFLEFENADWEKELADFYNTDVEVPAALTVDGRAYRDVGVHFRGMSSFAFVPEGSKRSLNLSIDFVRRQPAGPRLPDAESPERQQRPDLRARAALQPHRAAVRARGEERITCAW